MKKFIVIMLALAMLLTMASPVFAIDDASEEEVDTSVTLGTGTEIITIKAKWEQDCPTVLETGDPEHLLYIGDSNGTTANAQFLPPLVKCVKKPITYYMVITSNLGSGGDVSGPVFVDVFHPVNSPAPYDNPDDIHGPRFKYEIIFNKVPAGNRPYSEADQSAQQALLCAAEDAHLVTYASGFDFEEVDFELDEGSAALWMATELIDYEQPAGDYTVAAVAWNNTSHSATLSNFFNYVPVAGVEVDFENFNYGPVQLQTNVLRDGDYTWNTATPPRTAGVDANGIPLPIPERATVRNIGNTWAKVAVWQDDMGFGKVSDVWQVRYDIQMGADPQYKRNYFPNCVKADFDEFEGEPAQRTPNALGLSMKDKLDFSIRINKPAGTNSTYTGDMEIGATYVPFANPNQVPITGQEDPCPVDGPGESP